MSHVKRIFASCLVVIFAWSFGVAAASSVKTDAAYPRKPLRVIVGFTPAAATDLIARALAQNLSERMKIHVIVENRPGAGGNVSLAIGAKAAADGYTLIFNTGGLVQNYALYTNLSYHPLRDFIPVSMVSKYPLLLVANASGPYSNIAEFVAHAKANPGKLTYSSAGLGNVTHLGNVMFQQAVGMNALHVPYSGSAPALTDVMAGRIDYTTPTVASAMPFLSDKRLKPLVVLSMKRSPMLPNVPTAHETVASNLEVTSWNGVLVPMGTPNAIVKRLNTEIVTALGVEEVRSRLLMMGAEILPTSQEQYGAYIRTELERWTLIIKQANLSLK